MSRSEVHLQLCCHHILYFMHHHRTLAKEVKDMTAFILPGGIRAKFVEALKRSVAILVQVMV